VEFSIIPARISPPTFTDFEHKNRSGGGSGVSGGT
jgi:hypothetical protein